MKLILTHEVTGLGSAGDVVTVKDGYARNYLLPRGTAVLWSKGGEKQVSAIREARKAREVKSLDEAQQMAGQLTAAPTVVKVRAGSHGRLFGAVTQDDIAQAVSANGGPTLDKRRIDLGQHIKSLGTYPVMVRLHPEVQVTMNVEVQAA